VQTQIQPWPNMSPCTVLPLTQHVPLHCSTPHLTCPLYNSKPHPSVPLHSSTPHPTFPLAQFYTSLTMLSSGLFLSILIAWPSSSHKQKRQAVCVLLPTSCWLQTSNCHGEIRTRTIVRFHKWIVQKIGKTAGWQKCSVSRSHTDGQLQGPLLAQNVTLAKCLW
jgi:hypothetical protein